MRVSLALPLCLACLLVLPAAADVDAALDDHVLPGYARLADETAALDAAAEADCAPEALRPAFHAAYDAWVAISHIQTGP
ncbi:MAG: imelysin family protein, partial [Pseudomonadota bacterium]